MVVKRVLLYMQHPAEANLYRYVYPQLTEHGITVKVAIMERENIVARIVKEYADNYEIVGHTKANLFQKATNLINIDKILFKLAKEFKPDVITSFSSPYPGHIAALRDFAHIGYNDTEEAHLNTVLSYPFQNTVLTPSCYFERTPKNKHITFKGYKELAYLHPNFFNPDSSVLDRLGLSKDDNIVLMRFSAKDATHDIGMRGLNIRKRDLITKFIDTISKESNLYIQTELNLLKDLMKYNLDIPIDLFHSFLYFCTLYFGEGTTTACEAGILGAPWVLVSNQKRGYLIDQERNYGLGWTISDQKKAFEKALDVINGEGIKTKWRKKRQKLLKDKIDVTSFLVWFLKNYPDSHRIMKSNPNYQERFK